MGSCKIQGSLVKLVKFSDGCFGATARKQRYCSWPVAANGSLSVPDLLAVTGAPSAWRRMIAFCIDGGIWLLAFTTWFRMASRCFGVASVTLPASCAWLLRDQWLSPWGLQSPGRHLMGQQVLALDGPRDESL